MTLGVEERREAMIREGFWKDRTLLSCLEDITQTAPETIAIVSKPCFQADETRLTYAQLDQYSSTLAARFRNLGVGEGDVVSFQLPNWWHFTVIHLACLKLGAISNPLMTILRERELSFMLRLAESKVLIIPTEFRGFDFERMAMDLRGSLPDLHHVFTVGGSDAEHDLSWLLVPDEKAVFSKVSLDPDRVIQLLYTSGTTGEPKGVMHTSNTMMSNLYQFIARLQLSHDDVVYMPSPMGHQLGFMYGIMLPIMLGAKAVLLDIFSSKQMAEDVIREGATFTMGATPFLKDFVEEIERSGAGTPSLKSFVSAGAPIPRALVSNARKVLGAQIISGWGMSENGAVTTTLLNDDEGQTVKTDGKPLPGMDVKVVDERGQSVASGEEGHLLVRGCSNFVGYFKRPELANTDEDGWFSTGDLARKDDAGYIRIVGRSKDIIIRGGENIPVVEIEELIFKHPSVSMVAVVGFPDERLGERACAFVTLQPGCDLSFEELIDYLNSTHIAKQYLPERLEVISEFPSTPSGKIQKFALRDRLKTFESQPKSDQSEKTLWARIFKGR